MTKEDLIEAVSYHRATSWEEAERMVNEFIIKDEFLTKEGNLGLAIKIEGYLRKRLNDTRSERDRLEEECRSILERLNGAKRRLYRLGFKGNIMRDEDGNRVNSLTNDEEGDAKI